MWPTAPLLRLLVILTTLLIYLRRQTQLEQFFETAMNPLAVTKPIRMDLTLWLLLGTCCFALIRTARLHQMKQWLQDMFNLKQFTIFLGIQLQRNTKPFTKAEDIDWAALQRIALKFWKINYGK